MKNKLYELKQQLAIAEQDMDHAVTEKHFELACRRYNNLLEQIDIFNSECKINNIRGCVGIESITPQGSNGYVVSSIDIKL